MFLVIAVAIAVGWVSLMTGCTGGIRSASESTQREARMLSVRGRLTYRARIALSPESIAVIELRDVSSSDYPVIKEQRIALRGRQVPIPFELRVDRFALVTRRHYNVRGGILLAGKPIWVTEAVLIDPASVSADLGTLPMRHLSYTNQAAECRARLSRKESAATACGPLALRSGR